MLFDWGHIWRLAWAWVLLTIALFFFSLLWKIWRRILGRHDRS